MSTKPVNRRRPPQSDGRGKRRQRFTQRDVERASRAAPDRTIIIRQDGSLELVPTTSGNAASGQRDRGNA